MAEDDEAKQKAHEAAAASLHSASLPAPMTPNAVAQLNQSPGRKTPGSPLGVRQTTVTTTTTPASRQDEKPQKPQQGADDRTQKPAEDGPAEQQQQQQQATRGGSTTNDEEPDGRTQGGAQPPDELKSPPPRGGHHQHQHRRHPHGSTNAAMKRHQQSSSNNNIGDQHSSSSHQQAWGAPQEGRHGTSQAVSADYLAQLIKDKKQLAVLPAGVFLHVPRLIDDEIQRVRQQLFQLNDVVSVSQRPLELPEPVGELISLQEKIYVPVDEHPDYNFVGRLLGPRGMTAKQLEQETGCKIMIRGKGSMRDKKKVRVRARKPSWRQLARAAQLLFSSRQSAIRSLTH
jgi:hypothetical protein